jgi:hypothetical protein
VYASVKESGGVLTPLDVTCQVVVGGIAVLPGKDYVATSNVIRRQ